MYIYGLGAVCVYVCVYCIHMKLTHPSGYATDEGCTPWEVTLANPNRGNTIPLGHRSVHDHLM